MPKIQLADQGLESYVLLAACADAEGGGGVYCFDGETVERIDSLNTSGLACAGHRLARLSWSEPGDATAVRVYDPWGIERYYRLDRLGDAHQVAWDGERLVLASTATNRIVWLSQDGTRSEREFPGEGDSWHLNGLFMDGRMFASAFGKFTGHREWDIHRQDGSGIVFELSTGEVVLAGLNCPHSPKRWGGKWVVCSAADHAVVESDAGGAVMRRLKLHGWTRGLAATGDFLFVGVSVPRHDPASTGAHASIAVVCRRSWTLQRLIPVRSREISDLALVPACLAEGLRRSFSLKRTGRDRGLEPPGALPPSPVAPGLIVLRPTEAPQEVASGKRFECKVHLVNGSPFVLESAPPYPVHLAYHWMDQRGCRPVLFEGIRTSLSPGLLPGGSSHYVMRIEAPERAGLYLLRLTLVQESVRWFDQPPTALSADVPIIVGAL